MQGKQYPILIIEDDPNDVLLLQRAFQKNGITNPLQVLCNGEEAIEYFMGTGRFDNRLSFPFPHFILMDLKMPRKGGLEVIEWMRRQPDCSVIPILILTSSKEKADIKSAYCLGANSYMVKPTHFNDLQRMIRIIYDYWTLSEQPLLGPCD